MNIKNARQHSNYLGLHFLWVPIHINKLKNMKKIITMYIILFVNFTLYGQELSMERLQTSLAGYWKGNKFTNNQEVLVINGDNTYQYFKNKVRLDYGNVEVEYSQMFRLKFKSCFGDSFTSFGSANNYIWKLPDDMLQFGDSPVDGGDSFFEKMNSKERDDFLGKKLLLKAFKKKSEQLLLQYFSEWQMMESASGDWGAAPARALSAYQKEAYSFFSDFYTARLKSVKEPKYSIVEISLTRTGYADFSLLNFQKKLEGQKTSYVRLENFIPAFSGNKNITFLPLRADRARVINFCMSNNDKKNKNCFFIKKYLSSAGGAYCDITDTPMIQNLIFNTQLNLAIVEYIYTDHWVKDLYEKKDGKWQAIEAIEE